MQIYVIPALCPSEALSEGGKAGIQTQIYNLESEVIDWMPASAGMTK